MLLLYQNMLDALSKAWLASTKVVWFTPCHSKISPAANVNFWNCAHLLFLFPGGSLLTNTKYDLFVTQIASSSVTIRIIYTYSAPSHTPYPYPRAFQAHVRLFLR